MAHNPPVVLILDNIRSALNVGALFRTTEAAGVSHMHLIGYTPTPIDRFMRERADIHKSALGAELTVPWTHHDSIITCIKALQSEGYMIITLEQSPQSVDYRSITLTSPTAMIVGNEVEGVSNDALALSDIVTHIPMYGTKESLNVTTATGIALFRILHP